jgi:endonuclease/exonuclease/phosphatase family metal-dependent hydrolase
MSALVISNSLILPVLGIHFFSKNNMTPQIEGLKIMTWNVHGLGLFDKPFDKNKAQRIFNFVEQQQPDIICLIEFYTNVDGSNDVASKYFKQAGYKAYRFMYDNDYGSKIYIGNAIFSKYPLSNFEEIPIDEYIKLMRCDVTLPNEKKVRLFATHLQSFLLGDQEKALIEEVKSDRKKLEHQKSKSISMLEKMHRAYQKRAPQAILSRAEIDSSPYPTILCADLNDVPGSYTYFTIKGSMIDVFTKKGTGLGRTYNFIAPNLRIDYIFYDPKGLELIGMQTQKTTELSDHNPVVANFILK